MTIRALEKVGDTLTAAQCNICLLVWERPPDMDDDEANGDLGRFAQEHRERHSSR